jgi:hypothetical protein
MKNQIIMAKLIRQDEDQKEFDRIFWQKAGHEAKFSAAWDMVDEVYLMKGKHVIKSRLQRTVQNIKRRAG